MTVHTPTGDPRGGYATQDVALSRKFWKQPFLLAVLTRPTRTTVRGTGPRKKSVAVVMVWAAAVLVQVVAFRDLGDAGALGRIATASGVGGCHRRLRKSAR